MVVQKVFMFLSLSVYIVPSNQHKEVCPLATELTPLPNFQVLGLLLFIHYLLPLCDFIGFHDLHVCADDYTSTLTN